MYFKEIQAGSLPICVFGLPRINIVCEVLKKNYNTLYISSNYEHSLF